MRKVLLVSFVILVSAVLISQPWFDGSKAQLKTGSPAAGGSGCRSRHSRRRRRAPRASVAGRGRRRRRLPAGAGGGRGAGRAAGRRAGRAARARDRDDVHRVVERARGHDEGGGNQKKSQASV